MACPDDHPDDDIGKEFCRAWCPKNQIIWSKWHHTYTESKEICMHASPLPQAILLKEKHWLIGKAFEFHPLAALALLLIGWEHVWFDVHRRMYVPAPKQMVERTID